MTDRLDTITTIATQAAATVSRTYAAPSNVSPGEAYDYTHTANVTRRGDRVYVHVKQNAVITKADSQAMIVATWKAIWAAIGNAGEKAGVVRTKNNTPTGDWHMGTYFCDGRHFYMKIR